MRRLAIKRNNISVIYGVVMFIVAILFILFYSKSTSPVYETYGSDSAIFQTIGRFWTKGIVPYIGLFDHKGPLIFFINAVGYWLCDAKYGIAIIQVLFLYFTEYGIYKLYCKKLERRTSFILTVLTILSLAISYDEGNMTEEYALPFLVFSFSSIYDWLETAKNDRYEHNPKSAYIYGVTFAFCLLTRITNAVGLCIAVTLILIILLVKKQWNNIFQNAISFIIGTLTLVIPFMVYFGIKGSFYEMWYGTLLYNFEYAANSSFELTTMTMKEIIRFVLAFSNSLFLLFVGVCIIIYDKKQWIRGLLWVLVSAGTCYMFLNGNPFLHYCMIGLPYSCIGIVELSQLLKNKKKAGKKILYRMGLLLLVSFISFSVIYGLKKISYQIAQIGSDEDKLQKFEILKMIPEYEKNSFVAYNCAKEIYLEEDICPCYRYFILQDWQGGKSRKLGTEIYNTFKEGEAKWILVSGDHVAIQDILDNRYICVDEMVTKDNELCKLYHIR